jgi:predicted DNA-binding WGR domain protein/cell wall assembly regulator SMI1
MPRYELSDGASNKFWEITLDGPRFKTRYGRIGSAGQVTLKEYDSAETAKREHDKLVAEKVKKGYRIGRTPPAQTAKVAKPAMMAKPAKTAKPTAKTKTKAARAPTKSVLPPLERIKTWMKKNAPLLVKNLDKGAPASRLATLEKKLGFALPAELRELWSTHDGQKSEMNGFVRSLDLFGAEQALMERESTLMFVQFLREDETSWTEAGVREEEAMSDDWLPIAGRDSDLLVVCCATGRVFDCGKDAPPLHLAAESVARWLEQYAASIEAGEYEVEEGFGDYYLQGR